MSKMDVSLSELPDGWIWATVQEIAEFIRGVSYKKDESSKTIKEDHVPILRANNINRELNYTDLVYVPRDRIKDEQFIKAFDIVIAMSSGSKNLVGKAAQSYEDYHGAFGTFCGLVRVSLQLDRKFIGFFFQSPGYRNEISRLSSGMNINNLRRQHIESMCLPIPPLSEQHRIVAKLEELFTQLDASIDLLQELQFQLKQYRQSVLKSAFKGKLTEAWRAAYQNEIEPASVLLERLLKEQLEQIKTEGKMSKDNESKVKYKEPSALDISTLPELPDGWIWATVQEIAEFIRGVSYKKDESSKTIKEGHVPILRANNINRELNYTDLVYVPRDRIKDEQFIKAFDIVIAMSSGSKNLVGKAAQSYEDYHGAFGTFCGLVRVSLQLDRKFIGFFFQSPGYRNEISRLSSGMNINNLRRQHIESMCLPIPPLSEQHRIVSEVEHQLSIVDKGEQTVALELKRTKQLRQSILKKAFSGELVPQDKNNESASVLLEEIKAEKSQHSQEQFRLKFL